MSGNRTQSDGLGELKAQFLTSLNHEIRTPLSGIMGMLDLLLETTLTEEQRDYAESSHVCAENLLDIITSTLEYSALTANQIELEDAEFSMPETLKSVADEFAPKVRAKGLELTHEVDPRLPEVLVGDAYRLKQLLSHLMSNAVKFTREGGIELHAGCERSSGGAEHLLLSVSDTGVGIPAARLGSIFESFRRFESGDGGQSGLGLGLAVTLQLANLMKGEVEVMSEAGKGSTFTLRLPLQIPREPGIGLEQGRAAKYHHTSV